MNIELRKPKGRGGMGCKRPPGFPLRRMKPGKGLNRVSARRKKNHPVWESLREYLRDDLARRHGRPSGDGREIVVDCATCGSPTQINQLEPDHLEGRVSSGPGTLNPYWDPTLIGWKCHTCHEHKTNDPEGADHTDYDATAHPAYRGDTLALKQKIMERLGPIEADLKYPDADQAEAILWSIGLGSTCEVCGMPKCSGECADEGEKP